MARAAGAGIHADVIDDLKDELLIVFLRRMGGKVSIPVAEVDNTAGLGIALRVVNGVFEFELQEVKSGRD
jgi:hypothetical protein